MKLSEAISDWMVNYKKTSVKPSTYDRLQTSLDLLERYDIANVEIDKLDSDILQAYVNRLVEDGYAITTIKKQYHLLSAFITRANLKGIIQRPIHKGVNMPSESVVKKHRKEVIAYDHEDQQKLKRIFWTGESPAYFAAILMLETGIRIGEAMALAWRDVDWNRRAIRISKTVIRLCRSGKSYVQPEPKSVSSIRPIPLSKEALELLTMLKEADPDSNGFIFKSRYGNYLSYELMRWNIQKACNEANVEYHGLHVFRHTFATNCYEKGCDVKILSKLLGHASVTVTYNTYIHLYGDALEEMRAIVG